MKDGSQSTEGLIERGSIKERWFSSTIAANNGPLAAPDEGMSYVAVSPDSDEKFTLKESHRHPGGGGGRRGADGEIRRLAHVL